MLINVTFLFFDFSSSGVSNHVWSTPAGLNGSNVDFSVGCIGQVLYKEVITTVGYELQGPVAIPSGLEDVQYRNCTLKDEDPGKTSQLMSGKFHMAENGDMIIQPDNTCLQMITLARDPSGARRLNRLRGDTHEYDYVWGGSSDVVPHTVVRLDQSKQAHEKTRDYLS
jgi:hypothetical protein